MRLKIQGLKNYFTDKEYYGYKFHSVYEMEQYAAIEITFLAKDKYFRQQLSYHAVINMKINELIEHIENQCINHPDLKKEWHHKQFYNKFDEMLNG